MSLPTDAGSNKGSAPPSRRASAVVPQPQTFNPFIYGNDVDSVDVATRVAMVSYILYPVSLLVTHHYNLVGVNLIIYWQNKFLKGHDLKPELLIL